MALITCTECGREISDKAKKCPNCGCPIQVAKKKENRTENAIIECPECHKAVNADTVVCPYCGVRLKNKRQQMKLLATAIVSNKKYMAVMVLLIMICLIGVFVFTKDEYSKYTKYIGKNYKKLPDEFDTEDLGNEDDEWIASDQEEVKIEGIEGTVCYKFSKMYMPGYGAKAGEIYSMIWEADAEGVTDHGFREVIESLVEAYGNYDEKEIKDCTDEDYDYLDYDEEYRDYIWKEKKGMDIAIEGKYEDDELQWIIVEWVKVK